jgi:hypothetical protein
MVLRRSATLLLQSDHTQHVQRVEVAGIDGEGGLIVELGVRNVAALMGAAGAPHDIGSSGAHVSCCASRSGRWRQAACGVVLAAFLSPLVFRRFVKRSWYVKDGTCRCGIAMGHQYGDPTAGAVRA